MNRVLITFPERCTGCHICELVCSFEKTRSFNPKRSRITILEDEQQGVSIPVACRHCTVPLCMEACPTAALYIDALDGVVLFDEGACIGCRNCVLACPFGAVSIDPLTSDIIKCDLCNGNPPCVEYCPRDAIVYARADRVNIMIKGAEAVRLREAMQLTNRSRRA